MKHMTKYILVAVLLVSIATAGVLTAEMTENREEYKGPVEEIKDNVVLKTTLPTMPKEVFALKIENKNVDDRRSKKIAENILGIGTLAKGTESKQLENGKGTAIIDQNNQDAEITVYKRGQFKYSTGKEWSDKYRKEEMLSEKQAKEKALGYINKLVGEDMLSKGMVDSSKLEVADDEIYVYDTRNGKIESYVSNRHVNLEISYGGIPLHGAGAKVRVYLGKNGEVTGLLNYVGKLVPDKKVSVITPKQAIDKLKADGYKNIDINSIRLVYNTPPVDEDVDYIYPAYDIQGKMHTNSGEDLSFARIILATVDQQTMPMTR